MERLMGNPSKISKKKMTAIILCTLCFSIVAFSLIGMADTFNPVGAIFDFLGSIVTFLINMIGNLIAGIFTGIANLFLKSMDVMDFAAFEANIPGASFLFPLIQACGFGLAFGLLLWYVIQCLSPFSNAQDLDNPAVVALKSIAVFVGILFSKELCYQLYDFFKVPYDLFFNSRGNIEVVSFFDIIGNIPSTDIVSVGVDVVLVTTIIGTVLISLIGFNLVKLLLEIVERYVATFLMVYLSPLAFATAISSSTSGIFAKFLNMLVSQFVMMVLNVWSLSIVLGMFKTLGNGDLLIWCLITLSVLKFAQSLDENMKSLGANAIKTGRSMLDDMMQAGKSVAKAAAGAQGLNARSQERLGNGQGKGGVAGGSKVEPFKKNDASQAEHDRKSANAARATNSASKAYATSFKNAKAAGKTDIGATASALAAGATLGAGSLMKTGFTNANPSSIAGIASNVGKAAGNSFKAVRNGGGGSGGGGSSSISSGSGSSGSENAVGKAENAVEQRGHFEPYTPETLMNDISKYEYDEKGDKLDVNAFDHIGFIQEDDETGNVHFRAIINSEKNKACYQNGIKNYENFLFERNTGKTFRAQGNEKHEEIIKQDYLGYESEKNNFDDFEHE